MRKSNISHRFAKEKDFLVISLLFKHKNSNIKHKCFENDPAYEKFTRLKQEKLNNQLFLAEFHSSTHDNAFAFHKSPFVCITQSRHHHLQVGRRSSTNTKFCTSESF